MYDDINRNNVQSFKKDIGSKAATTFNRKLSSLKQFNEYLVGIGVCSEIVVYKQDYIPIQQLGNPTNISEKTVLKFLDRVNKKDCLHKSRNIALINLMAYTGIRREECCNLKLSNINLKENLIILRGKRNKERKIVLTKLVVEVIENYLIDRAKSKYADSEYLFLSDRGSKLTKESINGIFDFYCTPSIKVRCHDLRHNFISTMLERNKLSIVEIQDQVGHSSLTVTQKYLHPRLDSIKKKIRDFTFG
jgi:site-specific recombinase XerD